MLKYRDLTQEQKEKICNGCGSKGGFIKPPNFIFKASCNHHDFNYWRGNTKELKKKADKGNKEAEIEFTHTAQKFRAKHTDRYASVFG